jgi:hypothetical protein
MNASCIDCCAAPASSFSATALSARTTSSTSSIVMWDVCRGGRATAGADPVRRDVAPNSTRHLAVRDATSRKRRNFRTDNWPHPSFNRWAAAWGQSGDALGYPAGNPWYILRRANPIKEIFSGKAQPRFSVDRHSCRPKSLARLAQPHAVRCRTCPLNTAANPAPARSVHDIR